MKRRSAHALLVARSVRLIVRRHQARTASGTTATKTEGHAQGDWAARGVTAVIEYVTTAEHWRSTQAQGLCSFGARNMSASKFPVAKPTAVPLATLLHKEIKQLVHGRHFAQAKQPERALHDLRVASRKFRVFLDFYRESIGKKLRRRAKKQLKQVLDDSRATRDWTVQRTLVEGRLAPAGVSTKLTLEYLLERLDAQLVQVADRAERKLDDLDLQQLATTLRTAQHKTLAYLGREGPRPRTPALTFLEEAIARAEMLAPRPDGGEHPQQLHKVAHRRKEAGVRAGAVCRAARFHLRGSADERARCTSCSEITMTWSCWPSLRNSFPMSSSAALAPATRALLPASADEARSIDLD